MPAVNPLLAIVAPVSVPAKVSRQGHAPQDLQSARAPENKGSRAAQEKSEHGGDRAEKAFARELEKSAREARDESREDVAVQADSGKALPADGRPLPPAQKKQWMLSMQTPPAQLPADGSVTTQAAMPLANVQDLAATTPTALQPGVQRMPGSEAVLTSTLPAPIILNTTEQGLLPGTTGSGAQVTPSLIAQTAAQVTPSLIAQTAAQVTPSLIAQTAAQVTPSLIAQTAAQVTPSLIAQTAAQVTPSLIAQTAAQDAALTPLVTMPVEDNAQVATVASPVTQLHEASVSALAADASRAAPVPGAVPLAQPGPVVETHASVPSAPTPQGGAGSTNPFALLRTQSDAEAMTLAQQAASQQEADAQQAQSNASALALATGSDQTSLLDLTPGQGDLAERVRAWRGLSGQDGLVSPNLFSRSEAFGSSLFSQASSQATSQLQQFADSLRFAVNQAESPSLFASAERSASTSTSAPAVAPGALSSAATSSMTDAGGAWRADNLQMPALASTARPAAGTLQFMQTMQPSSFGAPLGETFGQSAWAESVTQRVSLMTGQKLSSARIELDPPELGAMTVKVSVSGDQASVSFSSPHALVRDALEQSFPRLQEMLGQQGLQLADAQVSDQSAERRQSSEADAGNRAGNAADADEGANAASMQSLKVATSLIDYYA